MTVTDLRCDVCGTILAGPAGVEGLPGPKAVRLVYHPGSYRLKDDSGLMCERCAAGVRASLGEPAVDACCRCGLAVEHARSLHVFVGVDTRSWQLCPPHGAEFLNGLRTVEPKIDPGAFLLAGDWKQRGAIE